ncbi:hypothetical protein B0O99DRAFT_682965 [Bisporella sp. PMI_857]|nr:hypothetical protein B0O99DRAFT_682965 [Bisporella sp. PMI_857]
MPTTIAGTHIDGLKAMDIQVTKISSSNGYTVQLSPTLEEKLKGLIGFKNVACAIERPIFSVNLDELEELAVKTVNIGRNSRGVSISMTTAQRIRLHTFLESSVKEFEGINLRENTIHPLTIGKGDLKHELSACDGVVRIRDCAGNLVMEVATVRLRFVNLPPEIRQNILAWVVEDNDEQFINQHQIAHDPFVLPATISGSRFIVKARNPAPGVMHVSKQFRADFLACGAMKSIFIMENDPFPVMFRPGKDRIFLDTNVMLLGVCPGLAFPLTTINWKLVTDLQIDLKLFIEAPLSLVANAMKALTSLKSLTTSATLFNYFHLGPLDINMDILLKEGRIFIARYVSPVNAGEIFDGKAAMRQVFDDLEE